MSKPVKTMTVKDLYDWAVKNKAENLNIRVAYYGYGGSMIGEKDAMSPIISENTSSEPTMN